MSQASSQEVIRRHQAARSAFLLPGRFLVVVPPLEVYSGDLLIPCAEFGSMWNGGVLAREAAVRPPGCHYRSSCPRVHARACKMDYFNWRSQDSVQSGRAKKHWRICETSVELGIRRLN
eukprot:8395058-Pyramimonas_sp.AAC.1